MIDHIADLGGLFREMHRVCRQSGFVVISVMHPAMMLRGVQARFKDPASGREIRPASCAHQLSDYVMAAVRPGFSLDLLSEQAVDEHWPTVSSAPGAIWLADVFLMRLAPASGSKPRRSVGVEMKTYRMRDHGDRARNYNE